MYIHTNMRGKGEEEGKGGEGVEWSGVERGEEVRITGSGRRVDLYVQGKKNQCKV